LFVREHAGADIPLPAAVPAGLRIATEAVARAEVGAYWTDIDSLRRTVFIPRRDD